MGCSRDSRSATDSVTGSLLCSRWVTLVFFGMAARPGRWQKQEDESQEREWMEAGKFPGDELCGLVGLQRKKNQSFNLTFHYDWYNDILCTKLLLLIVHPSLFLLFFKSNVFCEFCTMKILQKENHTVQNCSQNQAKSGTMVFFKKCN